MRLYRGFRELIQGFMSGSDHLADPWMQAERDMIHYAAGVLAGMSGVLAPLYIWAVFSKQRKDAQDPLAKTDARLDKRFSVLGTFVGMALLGGVAILAGPEGAAMLSLNTIAMALVAAVSSIYARGLGQ